MASAPTSQPACQPSDGVRAFAAEHYAESGAGQFGIDVAGLAGMLAEVVSQRGAGDPEEKTLESLRLEELVLARACMAGHEGAWELFMIRYRGAMFETAYKMAHDEAAARSLADSLYAELYGLSSKGETSISKLRYYLGRGSLAGWLRTVVAQEYVNQYRRGKRETSLEAAVEEGRQFAAAQPETAAQVDSRLEAATTAELAALDAEERFLLAAYYLDQHTLAEIAQLMQVHESTISRRLERVATGLRKGICKRLMQSGLSKRQAEEAMQEVDVRDLRIKVQESIGQDRGGLSFYKEKEG